MKRLTILAVDSHEENLQKLTSMISKNFSHIEVLSATNAHDAILTLMKSNVDVILSDFYMPDVDGFEFIEYLNDTEQTEDIPIILISKETHTQAQIQKGYELGIVDYIESSIEEEMLCYKLKMFMHHFEEHKLTKELISSNDQQLFNRLKINTMIQSFNTLPKSFQTMMNQYIIKDDYLSSLKLAV